MVDNAATLGAYAINRLKEMMDDHPTIGDVRGRGFLFGLELVEDRADKTPANDLAEEVFYRCPGAGLSFKITMGNNLTFTPPLVLTRDQLDQALDIV